MKKRRWAWLLWTLAAACLYFFENNGGTRAVLLASVLTPCVSLACAGIAARKARFSLAAPERMRKGETAVCRCKLAGGRLIGCWARCEIEARNSLTGDVSLYEVLISGESEGRFEVSGSHCGCLRLTAQKVVLTDWFELGRFSLDTRAEAAVAVWPGLYPVMIEEASSIGRSDSACPAASRAPAGNPESDLRDYQPGDPIRQIHWKLSAKTDQLLVRETPRFLDADCVLLLETAAPQALPEDWDAAVEALLSVSRGLAEEGFRHAVCWLDGDQSPSYSEVAESADWEAAADALLRTAAAANVSACRLLPQAYPEARLERIYVFAPSDDAAAPGMAEGMRIASVSENEPLFTF